jgi:hypothetical protein
MSKTKKILHWVDFGTSLFQLFTQKMSEYETLRESYVHPVPNSSIRLPATPDNLGNGWVKVSEGPIPDTDLDTNGILKGSTPKLPLSSASSLNLTDADEDILGRR